MSLSGETNLYDLPGEDSIEQPVGGDAGLVGRQLGLVVVAGYYLGGQAGNPYAGGVSGCLNPAEVDEESRSWCR